MILFGSILLFLVILSLNLIRDGKLLKRGLATNHNNRFWIRVWCLVASISGFSWEAAGHQISWHLIWQVSLSASMVAFNWMTWFDGLYNLRRDPPKPFLYPGSDGPEDGVIENLLQQRPWLQWVKIGLTVATTAAYCYFLLR